MQRKMTMRSSKSGSGTYHHIEKRNIMKKLIIALIAVVLCEICNAQVGNIQSGKVLSAEEAQYVLEVFCRYYY